MKVRKVSKTSSATANKSTSRVAAKPSISFQEVLAATDDQQTKEMLDRVLEEINQKGQELVEKRTVESLLAYKDMVKGFVEEAVNYGLKIDARRGFGRTGRQKVLRTVSNVDDQLIKLTDIVLGQEGSKLKILEKIGQIQGLLVNLYL